MKSILVTFFYPSVQTFVKDFLQSINDQTSKPDEVIIFNDGMQNFSNLLCDFNITYREVSMSGTPFTIRLQAFDYLKKVKADYIIFQDADDLMESNRIEVVTGKLNDFDVVVNDLSLMTDKGKLFKENIWKERLSNNFEFDVEFIMDKNIVGLGNTSIRKSVLEEFNILKSKRDILAADWFIFYQLLMNPDIKSIFTSETTTLYRQHIDNISTINRFDEDGFRKTKDVKKNHYSALTDIGIDISNYMKELDKIDIDVILSERNNQIDYFWWEL